MSGDNLHFGKYSVEVSRPDKVLFPDAAFTKRDLIEYYRKVADTMLPHVRGHVISMHRWPDGIEGEDFYQKEAPDYFPDWIKTVKVERENQPPIRSVLIENAATLVYLANQACITPHIWLSHADRINCPDRFIFDLDPPDDDFGPVREGAFMLKEVFEDVGLDPYVMTTGSRGLHVVAPLDRSTDFDTVREFAKNLAEVVAARDPEKYTTAQRKEKRRGRLFLDVMRNSYAQTAVAPYAVRARAGAPVATPLDWDELKRKDLGPRSYNIANIFRRLSAKKDPWAAMSRHARSLREPGKRLEHILADEKGD